MSEPCDDSPKGPTGPQLPGESPFAPRCPFAEYYRPPRLGIIHLLAWTAATAVLLKFSMAMDMIGSTGGSTAPVSAFQQVLGLIYSMTHAAELVGTAVLLLAKSRGLPGRFQPGHWLVLVATVTWLLFGLILFLWLLAVRAGFSDYSTTSWFLVLGGLTAVLCGGVYFYLTLASKDGRRWKTCFGVLAVAELMRGLSCLGSSLFGMSWLLDFFVLGCLIVTPTILVIVVVDLRRGPRRDWLHWVGPTMIGIGALVTVASWLWSTLAK